MRRSPLRPRDPAPRAARPRRAGRRAAVPARRHRDRRPPRHAAARRAGARRDGARRRSSRSATSSPTGRPRSVARLHGAGPRRGRPRRSAAQALWLALGDRASRSRPLVVGARRAARRTRWAATGRSRDLAARYLRIAALGLPFALDRARGPGLPARHRRPAHAARDRGRGQRRQRRARAAVRLRLRLGPRRARRGAR